MQVLQFEAIYNTGEIKKYFREKCESVVKNIKLRFHRNGNTYRYGPYKMEISSHRLTLTPEGKSAGTKIIKIKNRVR